MDSYFAYLAARLCLTDYKAIVTSVKWVAIALIPLAILGGAVTLLLSDVLARVLIAPSTIPVGIVTALAGTPFFLYILRRAKREVFW